ncbi:hypothetical protein CCS01_17545 [Rhodopila globiformis]|uniref:Uncharacterized protein n=1 Tax=Rhodopila globiformis TaxID=1071 RepID=A0A2S6N9N6_RHOGL|nr:hypothetical protein CCS01_17545 [Rhodopila globiformis]
MAASIRSSALRRVPHEEAYAGAGLTISQAWEQRLRDATRFVHERVPGRAALVHDLVDVAIEPMCERSPLRKRHTPSGGLNSGLWAGSVTGVMVGGATRSAAVA